MKKAIVIPDSFKGTLSSTEICRIVNTEIRKHYPSCDVISVPVADGGEGSVDCFLTALSGTKVNVSVSGPFFDPVEAAYGLINEGQTAVIEMAACAGLPLVEGCKDPEKTTTYGVGEMILDAAKKGVKEIILGLGGSATNDGGTGAAAAAGVCFLNQKGDPFIPTGGTLTEITDIDSSKVDPVLSHVKIITMCDIDNPLCGEQGASAVFGPQKGADPEMVARLDKGLLHLSEILKEKLNADVKEVPGAGAAGGMGAGMIAFFGSQLQMGIETVLDTVAFDDLLQDADVVFTGEGRMDEQSLRGKVVIGVSKRAGKQKVPVIVIAGGLGEGTEKSYGYGVTAAFSVNRLPLDFSVSRSQSRENLRFTVDNILRLWKAAENKE